MYRGTNIDIYRKKSSSKLKSESINVDENEFYFNSSWEQANLNTMK